MYVNYTNPSFNPHRQYTYLRHHGSDTLLIAVNFGDEDVLTDINLPEHAFGHLGLKPGIYHGRELLSGTTADKEFTPCTPFSTVIPAHGAVIWKLTATD